MLVGLVRTLFCRLLVPEQDLSSLLCFCSAGTTTSQREGNREKEGGGGSEREQVRERGEKGEHQIRVVAGCT